MTSFGPGMAKATTYGNASQQSVVGATSALSKEPLAGSSSKPLERWHYVVIILAVAVPDIIVLVFFSDVGVGSVVYNAVSPTKVSLLGDLLCSVGVLMLAALYVANWFEWTTTCLRFFFGALPVITIMLGAIAKGRNYPWAPVLFTLLAGPVILGEIRFTTCRNTCRGEFYRFLFVTFWICGMCALAVAFFWVIVFGNMWNHATRERVAASLQEVYENVVTDMPLDYKRHCHPVLQDVDGMSKDDRALVAAGCDKAGSVLIFVFFAPLFITVCNVAVSVFCAIHGFLLDANHEGDSAKMGKVVNSVKLFLISLAFVIGGMYCTTSLVSVELTIFFMALFAMALVVVMVWTYVELGFENLKLVANSKLGPYKNLMVKAMASDWIKAILVGSVNLFIPFVFILNYLKERVRVSCRGKEPRGTFSPSVGHVWGRLVTSNWSSVLTKVAILSELFFVLQVGFTKATYVFLSWLIRQLAAIDFVVVCILVFFVGWTMFLLPPVPGVPVYVFTGIVVADVASRKMGDNGFLYGILIAIGLSFLCKMVACVCQYSIGFFLGKKVKIQQLIAVDSVPTRAVEAIVKRRGINVAKVAVLIGGPDWPVSVTCGILQLSIPQMLIGTAPVIVILSPCVLAGAFISRKGQGGEDSIWPVLSNLASILAMVAQLSALLVAGVLILKEMQDHGEELAKPREEHAQIAALTKRELRAKEAYNREANHLKCGDKFLLLSMTLAHLGSGMTFVLFGSLCFLPFSVDKDINAPIDDGGLGGDPFAIVRPLGRAATLVFFCGVLLHVLHVKILESRARKALAKGGDVAGRKSTE